MSFSRFELKEVWTNINTVDRALVWNSFYADRKNDLQVFECRERGASTGIPHRHEEKKIQTAHRKAPVRALNPESSCCEAEVSRKTIHRSIIDTVLRDMHNHYRQRLLMCDL